MCLGGEVVRPEDSRTGDKGSSPAQVGCLSKIHCGNIISNKRFDHV